MSSDLADIVASLQLNNYLSLMVPIAVLYDYVITLPDEINYVWLKPWSFVTLMFFLVRCLGLILAANEGLYGTTFIPGPLSVGIALLYLDAIGSTIFLAASDIVMVLRVYALWNKSKAVLGVLLVFYLSEIILFSVSAPYYVADTTTTATQVLDMSFCNSYTTTTKLSTYKFIPRIALSALLVIFVIGRFCMDAFYSYRTTRQLQINRYIQLLVREGVLYFAVHLFFVTNFGQGTAGTIVSMLATIVTYIITPRFIMSVRVLYAASSFQVSGPSSGVDTGFGIGKNQGVSQLSTVGFVHSVTMESEATEENVEMQELK